MGFRITTNMMMNTYKYNLQNSTKKLSDARDMVLTQRNFNRYEEDPAAATQAFRLRRTYSRTVNQLNNTKDCYSKYNTAWNNLGGIIDKLSNPLAKTSSILGLNGTAGESRQALAQVLRSSAESVIHSMNQKLGDQFIFAGNDGLNVPFTWSADGKTLYYRGVNVNAGGVQAPTAKDPKWFEGLDAIKQGEQAKKLVNGTSAAGQAMKAWSDDVNNGGTLTTAAADTTLLKWLDKFAAEDVANGKMSASDAAEWIKYYKDPTNTPVPTDDQGNALKAPDWATQITNVSEWDENETAQVWYDYYMGISDTEPNATKYPEPSWIDDLKNVTEQEMQANGATPEEIAVLDDWVKYYKRDTTDKPLLEQSQAVKDWGVDDMKEGDLYPAKLPRTADGLTGSDLEWYRYYNDKRDLANLKTMSEEEMYIDLGMGAKENAPNDPILGSYFNNALSGLNFIGYGTDNTDEFGDSGNYALLLKEMADVFDDWHESGQKYLPEKYQGMTADELKAAMEDADVKQEINEYHAQQEAKALRLLDKLKASQEHLTENYVDLDAQSKFLVTNQERLETQQTNLNEEILNVEQVDLADAITQFSWEQYCYNAALKIGNQLLTQSLIDYMN